MRVIYLFILLFSFIQASCNNDIAGYYLTPRDEVTGRTSIVEIIKKDGKYFGYNLLFMDELITGNDANNENSILRDRKILGSVFIFNLIKINPSKYTKGRYYDFNSGKIFHLRANFNCNDITFIISVDSIGIFGSKKLYKRLQLSDISFYLKKRPIIDFSGVESY